MKKSIIAVFLIALLVFNIFTFAACDSGKHQTFDKQMVFKLDGVKSGVVKILPVGIPIGIVIDMTATFNPDGTATICIEFKKNISLALSSLAQIGLDVEAALSGLDIESVIIDYVEPHLPGFDITDPTNALEILKHSIGLEIIGIDMDDPRVIAIGDEFLQTGGIPSDVLYYLLPKIKIQYNCNYYIEDIVSHTGDVYKGVFAYTRENYGEPYLAFNILEDEYKRQILNINIELFKANIKLFEQIEYAAS